MKPFNYLANAVRAPEIVAILVRWGFEDLLLQLDTPKFLLKNLVREKVAHLTTYERLRNACEELGPIFVKFGQILGARPDKLPGDLVTELKKLRSHVEPQAFERIKPVLRKELGQEPGAVFSEFDDTPVAAGSLGQVYRARLAEDGAQVAVKVQRADIHKTVAADMEIVAWFARQLHHYIEGLRPYNLPELVAEVEERLREELDFRNEANNAEIFTALNPEREAIFAPRVYESLTSRRLLVTEWVEGVPPDEGDFSAEEGRRLARLGGDSVFHQIVVSGFFHSDPHGGNMLVTADRRLCFLDWGQAGQLTRDMRYDLADLLSGIAARNTEKVLRVAERISSSNRRIDRGAMEKQVTLLLNRHRKLGPAGTKIGAVGLELIYTFGMNGVKVPPDYALLAKAILSVEETARRLDPEFDLQACAKPFLERLNRERWSPSSVYRQTFWPLMALGRRLHEVPADFQRLLRRIEEEDISLKLRHTGTEGLQQTFNASMNRLTVGIIVGALIIGSSLIITTGVKPFLWGYPAIGILGFIASGVLGLYIVVSTLRKPHR